MVFQYFTGDFNSRSNGEGDSRMGSGTTIGLYDGNIVNTSTLSPTGDNRFSSYNYRYDLLGRLIESKDTRASTTNNFTSRYSYDQNGNLKGLSRRHYNFSTQIDSLQYTWATDPSTSFVQNRVASVTDIAGATATINNDFEGTENYNYDGSGNLTNDGTRLIRWTADGKVKEIQFPVSSTLGDIQNIRYLYDASGNRVVKLVTKVNSPSNVNNRDRTIYARDANGQVLAIYENPNQGPSNPTITPCIQLNIKFEIPTAACTWTATMCSGYTIVGDKVMIAGPILIHKDPIIGCDEARDLMFPIGTIISLSGSIVNTDYGPAFVSVKIQNGNPKATSSNITKFTISDPSIMPRLAEWHVYGNEQQGKFATRYPDKETYYLQDLDNDLKHRRFARHFDIKNYELKDHLGNVRTIVGDVKLPTITGLYPSSPYTADVRNRSEYYPYGWEIKLVGGAANTNRYGYNGTHLRDNEVKGEGNYLDFGGFGYDSRTAMRSNIEPLIQKYPGHSSYMVFGDNPIKFADLDGNDFGIIIDHREGSKSIIIVATVYTNSEKTYLQALAGAAKWNATQANIDCYNVNFYVNVISPESGNYTSMIDAPYDIIRNEYYGTEHEKSKPVYGKEFVAGQTLQGKYIIMNTHKAGGGASFTVRALDDLGNYVDFVKHELGHIFGLDDEKDSNPYATGAYYPGDGGTMEYKGMDQNQININDIKTVLQYAKDYLLSPAPDCSNVQILQQEGTSNGDNPIGVKNDEKK